MLETDTKAITADKDFLEIIRPTAITDVEFVALIKEYEVVLYKVAYQYVRNEHDAKEMVSETVYKGYKSRKSLKQAEYFRTWITKILIRNCLNYIKRSNRLVPTNDEMLKNIDNNIHADSLEKDILISEALYHLKHEYKTVLLLRYYQDLSIKETSNVMGIPENTVKTYTSRALRQLKKFLKENVL